MFDHLVSTRVFTFDSEEGVIHVNHEFMKQVATSTISIRWLPILHSQ